MRPRHESVLLAETLEHLFVGAGLYLDATLGDAGHASALLALDPGVRLLGCDRDPAAIAFARERLAVFGARVMLAHATFGELPEVHARSGGEPLAGALFDFGLSSRQIDDARRGVSFASDGPLDMRMDPSRGASLAERLAGVDVRTLARVLREFGDVPGAPRIARSIVQAVQAGRLPGTRALAELVGRAAGSAEPRRLAPVFQALRIWVNDELTDIDAALAWLPGAVREDGVVVTIAYHSGEDRRVKQAFQDRDRPRPSRRLPERPEEHAGTRAWQALTKKGVTPSAGEQQANPRARSARLRAYRRIGT